MNVCVCRAKQEDWEAIINVTDQVVDFNPKSVKAWFYRGKAYRMLEEFENAMKALEKGLEVDPMNQTLKKEHSLCLQQHKKFIHDQQSKYSKLFT